MLNFDVICVGDAKIDIFLILPDSSPYIHLDQKNLCLEYGQKIPVDSCPVMPGGNAANTAVGLSRLSLQTAVIAEIGTDEFSGRIINNLKDENINTDHLIQKKSNSPSFSVILSYKKDRTILGHHSLREHNFSFDNFSTKMIYLTSLGDLWENAYQRTLEFTQRSKALLAFNPGSKQLKEKTNKIKNVLKTTDILFVNKQEAEEILYEKEMNCEINKDMLLSIQKLGPKTVILTDGKYGSYALNEKGGFFNQVCVDAEVVEKTGAGDAYTSGFLAATLLNLNTQEAMRWGTLNAAGTITKIGAQNGLLFKNQMEEAYAKQSWL